MSTINSGDPREHFAHRIQQEAGIKTPGLINGLRTVPREKFVGPGPWMIMRPETIAKGYETTPDADPKHLYDTVLVALDAERKLNNGEPSSLLKFLDILRLVPGDRFLHVGCGVGYYSAIAAVAVTPGGVVTGIEIDPLLAERAERNLSPYRNITVVRGDGSVESAGSFNSIFINAGCTEVQSTWLDQLEDGGRLLIPLTVALPNMPGIGAGFMLLLKRIGDRCEARSTLPVGIFHCTGSRTDEGNALLQKSFAKGNHQSICRLRRDEHIETADCWLHRTEFCLSIT